MLKLKFSVLNDVLQLKRHPYIQLFMANCSTENYFQYEIRYLNIVAKYSKVTHENYSFSLVCSRQ